MKRLRGGDEPRLGERTPTVLARIAAGLIVAAVLCTYGQFLGCDGSPSSPGGGWRIQVTPSPTPQPATCSAGACPILVSIVRLAEAPNVAMVAVIPPGPFDLWQNGIPRAYPNGFALVHVGDTVSVCRCCGCSFPYLVF